MQRLLLDCEFYDAPGLTREQKQEILQGTAEARDTQWELYERRQLLPMVSQGEHTRRLQRAFMQMGLKKETLDPDIMTTVDKFIRDVELSDSLAEWSSDSEGTTERSTRVGT